MTAASQRGIFHHLVNLMTKEKGKKDGARPVWKHTSKSYHHTGVSHAKYMGLSMVRRNMFSEKEDLEKQISEQEVRNIQPVWEVKDFSHSERLFSTRRQNTTTNLKSPIASQVWGIDEDKKLKPRLHYTQFIGTARLKLVPGPNFISVQATKTKAENKWNGYGYLF